MRRVILPVMAQISGRTKHFVENLQNGDQIQGYDYRNGKVALVTLTSVSVIKPVQKILLTVPGFRIIAVTRDTKMLSPQGECTVFDKPRQLIGFCQKNPINLLEREVGHFIEYAALWEVKELRWEGPQYIWAEGMLVGEELVECKT